MTGPSIEPVTAIVCTRNRGDSVVGTVTSILANDHPAISLIVVDQSDGDDTQQAMALFADDARLRYVRTETRGVSRARNIGLTLASTTVVAITDDDCEVPPDWLRTCQVALDDHSAAVLLLCSVLPGPHDETAGFIPAQRYTRSRVLRDAAESAGCKAMGAGMAVRRRQLLEIGGFDEMLGPGATFRCGEDRDLVVRVLLAGHEVCESDTAMVTHHGFRRWSEGRDLTRRDWFGIGAAQSKLVRIGRPRLWLLPLHEVVVYAIWPPLNDLLHARRPRGLGRSAAFAHGFVSGLRGRLDRDLMLFEEQ